MAQTPNQNFKRCNLRNRHVISIEKRVELGDPRATTFKNKGITPQSHIMKNRNKRFCCIYFTAFLCGKSLMITTKKINHNNKL